MKKTTWLLLLTLITTNAWASATRIINSDQLQSADLSKTWSLPAATDTIIGRVSTDTLTGKTMSGASNTFSAIPVGAIGNGSVLSGSNTGDVTLGTASGLSLSGQILSLQLSDATHTGALSSTDWSTFNGKLSSALTTNHIFAGVGGVATDVAVSGDLTAVGGAFTIGAKKVQASKLDSGVSAAGTVATADGSGGVSYLAVSVSPSLSGTRASPTLITAVGGVSFSGSAYDNIAFIAGDSGPVTVTANPQVAAGSAVGQRLVLIGRDGTNTVTLADGTGLSLNGTWVGAADSVLSLVWDGSAWVETSRR